MSWKIPEGPDRPYWEIPHPAPPPRVPVFHSYSVYRDTRLIPHNVEIDDEIQRTFNEFNTLPFYLSALVAGYGWGPALKAAVVSLAFAEIESLWMTYGEGHFAMGPFSSQHALLGYYITHVLRKTMVTPFWFGWLFGPDKTHRGLTWLFRIVLKLIAVVIVWAPFIFFLAPAQFLHSLEAWTWDDRRVVSEPNLYDFRIDHFASVGGLIYGAIANVLVDQAWLGNAFVRPLSAIALSFFLTLGVCKLIMKPSLPSVYVGEYPRGEEAGPPGEPSDIELQGAFTPRLGGDFRRVTAADGSVVFTYRGQFVMQLNQQPGQSPEDVSVITRDYRTGKIVKIPSSASQVVTVVSPLGTMYVHKGKISKNWPVGAPIQPPTETDIFGMVMGGHGYGLRLGHETRVREHPEMLQHYLPSDFLREPLHPINPKLFIQRIIRFLRI